MIDSVLISALLLLGFGATESEGYRVRQMHSYLDCEDLDTSMVHICQEVCDTVPDSGCDSRGKRSLIEQRLIGEEGMDSNESSLWENSFHPKNLKYISKNVRNGNLVVPEMEKGTRMKRYVNSDDVIKLAYECCNISTDFMCNQTTMLWYCALEWERQGN